MFRFFSSLFSLAEESNEGPDEDLLTAAIERVVDGTDPRLRGFSNYQKRLRASVECAVIHVLKIVEDLPVSVEISRRTFTTDPRLRAIFVSPGHLQKSIGECRNVKEYLAKGEGVNQSEIFGLLITQWKEKNVLGMDLHGDIVRRDVPQVSISFSNHRYLGAAASESDCRWEVKKKTFDYLIKRCLERIVNYQEKRSGLEQQHGLLQHKLNKMKSGNWGMESILAEEESLHPDLEELEQEIEAVEVELQAIRDDSRGIERNFDLICEVLDQPGDLISWRKIDMNVDLMSIKRDASDPGSSNHLELDEFFAKSGERRIALFGRFPTAELPERTDMLAEAERYLGS